MDAPGVQAIMEQLLADALADLPAAPDRYEISHGPPAVDFDGCSLLAVYLASVTPRQLLSNPRVTESCVQVPQGRFGFQTWRCSPTDVPAPGMDAITTASFLALADALAIWNGINDRRKDGTLLPPGPPALTAIVSLLPLRPQGGMAGYEILLDVELSRPSVPSAS